MEASDAGKSGGKLWRLASAVNTSKQILPHTSASAAEARRMITDGSPECTACDDTAMVVLSLPKSRPQPRKPISAPRWLIVPLLDDQLFLYSMIAIQISAPF